MNKEEHISNSDIDTGSDTDDDVVNNYVEKPDDGEIIIGTSKFTYPIVQKTISESGNSKLTQNNKKSVEEEDDCLIIVAGLSKDGLSATDAEYANIPQEKRGKLKSCMYCGKFYNPEMMTNPFEEQEAQCWHCYFWLKHDLQFRESCDGELGMTIVEYILKCRDDHKVELCKRNTDGGGCFICEHKQGLDIPNCKDGHKINSKKTVVSSTNSEMPKLVFQEDDVLSLDDLNTMVICL